MRITDEQALANGIEPRHDRMDNGEHRYRLNCNTDGTSYCRTEAAATGAWQNSHYHKTCSELYVVQSGWMVYASIQSGELQLQVLKEGESVIVQPFVHHNIYLAPQAVIHTIKYGTGISQKDWYSSPQLDEWTKPLDPSNLVGTES